MSSRARGLGRRVRTVFRVRHPEPRVRDMTGQSWVLLLLRALARLARHRVPFQERSLARTLPPPFSLGPRPALPLVFASQRLCEPPKLRHVPFAIGEEACLIPYPKPIRPIRLGEEAPLASLALNAFLPLFPLLRQGPLAIPPSLASNVQPVSPFSVSPSASP